MTHQKCSRRWSRVPVAALSDAELRRLLDLPVDPLAVPALPRAARIAPSAVAHPAAVPGSVPAVLLGQTGPGPPFALPPAALAGHAYLLGPSGTARPRGWPAGDRAGRRRHRRGRPRRPHGDLVRQVLTTLPTAVLPRVRVRDLGDLAYLPTVNPLWVPANPGDPAGTRIARAVRSAAVTAVFADLWNLHRAATRVLPTTLHDGARCYLPASGRSLLTAAAGAGECSRATR